MPKVPPRAHLDARPPMCPEAALQYTEQMDGCQPGETFKIKLHMEKATGRIRVSYTPIFLKYMSVYMYIYAYISRILETLVASFELILHGITFCILYSYCVPSLSFY